MHDDERLVIPKELRLKIEKITAQHRVTPANLELIRRPDVMLEQIIIECVRKVCYQPGEPRVIVPTTWWDALKQRWFPLWALARWPISLTTYEARVYFPELEIPRHGDRLHIHFFDWHKEIHRGTPPTE